ncbi:MAG: hypothetical protein ACE5Q6_00905 [Dehalococcoidia bacterium]
MAASGNFQEQHQDLSQAWLEAEGARVAILHRLLEGMDNKCISDFPDHFFKEYDEALSKAVAANREYVQWLAMQGIRSR